MVMGVLWRGPGFELDEKYGLLFKRQIAHPFRCEDNNGCRMHVQPHVNGLRQVEPHHRLSETARHSSKVKDTFFIMNAKASW